MQFLCVFSIFLYFLGAFFFFFEFFMCLIMKIFGVHLSSIFCVFYFIFLCTFFAFFASADRRSRYIRYRNNIEDNQYGESYNIGNKQYSSQNLSYGPIQRFLESAHSLGRSCDAGVFPAGRTARRHTTSGSSRPWPSTSRMKHCDCWCGASCTMLITPSDR